MALRNGEEKDAIAEIMNNMAARFSTNIFKGVIVSFVELKYDLLLSGVDVY
jgi:hypothetical protein